MKQDDEFFRWRTLGISPLTAELFLHFSENNHQLKLSFQTLPDLLKSHLLTEFCVDQQQLILNVTGRDLRAEQSTSSRRGFQQYIYLHRNNHMKIS